jgi:(p)ppGpp synthase/HD superfamily hydrolase
MQLTARFSEALAYAGQLHAEQVRKGSGVPYLAHLLSVAAIVLEHGADEDEAIAALLHDAVEDQGGDVARQEIRGRFGRRVADIVDGCTDADTIPKPPWRARKETYLAHLVDADRSVHLVCAADKLHNARSLVEDYRACGELLWNRFSGGKTGTLWYYRAVTTVLATAGQNALVEELQRTVAELERMAAGAPKK